MFLCLPFHWRPVFGSLSLLFCYNRQSPSLLQQRAEQGPSQLKEDTYNVSPLQKQTKTHRDFPIISKAARRCSLLERERRGKTNTKRRKKQLAQTALSCFSTSLWSLEEGKFLNVIARSSGSFSGGCGQNNAGVPGGGPHGRAPHDLEACFCPNNCPVVDSPLSEAQEIALHQKTGYSVD